MKKVLILGSRGLFGSHAVTAFAQAGWQVQRFQRGADMTAAAMGVDVIVNALNPPNYHDWARLIPQITAQVIAVGHASGATVLLPGNVYPYGDQAAPWTQTTPHRPVAAKGRVRADMEATYRQATAQGLRVIMLRGGDFMAPGNPAAVLNLVVLKALSKGRITTMGDAEVLRAYAYLPDMARAAVGLSELQATLPAFTDVPFAGDAFSIAQVAATLEGIMERKLKIKPFLWWLMGALSPFWELVRELREMRYLYSTAHWLPKEPLQTLLPGFCPTPLDTILREHLAVRP